MILPNSYSQDRLEKNADVANGHYLLHALHALRERHQAPRTQALREVDQEEQRHEE